MGIPWEVIIKTYRAQLGDRSFQTLNEYKNDFLTFLATQTGPDRVSNEMKAVAFYDFFKAPYGDISNRLQTEFTSTADHFATLTALQERTQYLQIQIDRVLEEYLTKVQGLSRNANFTLTQEDFEREYDANITDIVESLQSTIINPVLNGHIFSVANRTTIRNSLYSLLLISNIFESHSGLVFMGYGENEVFPSSHQVKVGYAFHNMIRTHLLPPITMNPITNNGQILPYAQLDVTYAVLTGVNPSVLTHINSSVSNLVNEIINEVPNRFNDDEQTNLRQKAVNLQEGIKKHQQDTITNPIIKMVSCMSKEDIAELAESLVNVTSLIRKFSETNESVGGPVDVAVITKGDGFIWMKRKHYFDTELNKNYLGKYYK